MGEGLIRHAHTHTHCTTHPPTPPHPTCAGQHVVHERRPREVAQRGPGPAGVCHLLRLHAVCGSAAGLRAGGQAGRQAGVGGAVWLHEPGLAWHGLAWQGRHHPVAPLHPLLWKVTQDQPAHLRECIHHSGPRVVIHLCDGPHQVGQLLRREQEGWQTMGCVGYLGLQNNSSR